MRAGTPGLAKDQADNINGPSLLRVPAWAEPRLGRYLLYFAHHHGRSIRLAYADALEGPWTVHPVGALHLEDTHACDHIASPDVHVDETSRRFRMYFHGCGPGGREDQASFLAFSQDGLRFSGRPERLGPFYFRVFGHDGWHYALAKRDDASGVLLRSRDGLSDFDVGPELLPRMRHAAVLREGSRLLVVFSRIGDAPESLLSCSVDLAGDWRTWTPSEAEVLLAPETDYEGAAEPLRPSRPGRAWGRERALRDPALLLDEDRLVLAYSVAGEQGVALAEILRD